MRPINLTQEYLKDVLYYNPLTGIFLWKHNNNRLRCWNTRYAGTQAGYKNKTDGYIYISIQKVDYTASRLAWLYMTGNDPGDKEIDHKDRVRDNNIWENLRLATSSQNNANRDINAMGIRFNGKWIARIKCDKKERHLGTFVNKESARAAYIEAGKKLFGEYFRETL